MISLEKSHSLWIEYMVREICLNANIDDTKASKHRVCDYDEWITVDHKWYYENRFYSEADDKIYLFQKEDVQTLHDWMWKNNYAAELTASLGG